MPVRKGSRLGYRKKKSSLSRKGGRKRKHVSLGSRIGRGLSRGLGLASRLGGYYAGAAAALGAARAAAPYVVRTGQALGRYGRYLGPHVGNVVRSLPAAFRFISGSGDYYTGGSRMNMGKGIPKFSTGNNCVTIAHREYIGTVSSATSFTNTTYSLNPGIAATFPWLSGVAQQFEEYDFKGLVFQFRSTSANSLNSTNTALGTIIGAVQYNALNDAFASRQQMENYEYSKSGKPSVDNLYPVECDFSQNPLDNLYIRNGPVPSGADARLYDLGTFNIAADGSQAAAVVGELWVSYNICLYKPKLLPTSTQTALSCHWQITPGNVASATPLGSGSSAETEIAGSSLSISFTGAGAITFPASVQSGKFYLHYHVTGSSTVLTNPVGITYTSNCSAFKGFDAATLDSVGQPAATTSTRQWRTATFQITGPSAVITLGTTTTMPGSVAGCDLWILPFDSDMDPTLEQKSIVPKAIIHDTEKEHRLGLRAQVVDEEKKMHEFEQWKARMAARAQEEEDEYGLEAPPKRRRLALDVDDDYEMTPAQLTREESKAPPPSIRGGSKERPVGR